MRIIYLTAVLLMAFSSCSKWLEVTPKDIVAEREMFKIGEGYRNALNGVYRDMSTSSMYGKEMSWGMVDVIGQCYRTGTGIAVGNVYYEPAYNGNYSSLGAKSIFSAMWLNAYNLIANCNNLIEKITKEEPSKFRGGKLEQDMILGEAYALRGFLHFDMLRLFAKAPVKGANEMAIPYFKRFKSTFEPQKTTMEVLDLVIDDMKKGLELVINFDTLTVDNVDRKMWMKRSNRFSEKWGETSQMPSDIFYGFRGYRMNHLAISAALARVYNYAGRHEEAIKEATRVINFKMGADSELAFIFTPRIDVAGDRKLSSGIIFTLAEKEIREIFSYFTDFDKNRVELLKNGSYTSDFDDQSDYRRTELLTPNKSTYYYIPNKYIAPAVTNNYSEMVSDMLPMIRLSEMYYIAAEAYASKSDYVTATEMLDKVRNGRNCKVGILKITDEISFRNELIKEVKREFICEGQTFFYYKKLNILPKSSLKESIFVIPLPDIEIDAN